MKTFQDKVVLVTGSGRGIGAATAKLFAAAGARVVIMSRTDAELKAVQKEIEKDFGGGRVLYLTADVSEESSVREVFEAARKTFGSVDILINNAAILSKVDLIDQEVDDWDRLMAVNMRGPFLCSREFLRQAKVSGRGGVIINISSLAGIRGVEKFKGLSAYTASKHGMIGLTESLVLEAREYGVRVHAVAPGLVDTAMLRQGAPFLKTRTKPGDIAEAVLFLCDESRYGKCSGTILEMHTHA